MNDAHKLETNWSTDSRWKGITRPYSAADVIKLRGSIEIKYSLAELGAKRLWQALQGDTHVAALGALTGGQALQQVEAGLKAIYVSGWQVAADANISGQMYPDQSLYAVNSVPELVRRINNSFQRADQIANLEGRDTLNWFVPIVADAEAGFGGTLNAFELMKAMIDAGAAAVHFEDQLASAKKCGHMGGKVLVPTGEAIQKLVAARLAADVMGVSTLIVARTDANGAGLITSDIDERDQQFLTGGRTVEGFFEVQSGLDQAITRGIAYAPYADLVWCETSSPNLDEARAFAAAIHERYPGKLLAYNCSPSFNWKQKLGEETIACFQSELARMGYKFQFITLAGFHALNLSMFELAQEYRETGMTAYAQLQQREFERASDSGYRAVKHQAFVGTGYFDAVAQAISSGTSSVMALSGSTEEEQFTKVAVAPTISAVAALGVT